MKYGSQTSMPIAACTECNRPFKVLKAVLLDGRLMIVQEEGCQQGHAQRDWGAFSRLDVQSVVCSPGEALQIGDLELYQVKPGNQP
jgi:hypothetical protein